MKYVLHFSSVLGFGLISKHVQCTLCLFYKNIKNIWASAPYEVLTLSGNKKGTQLSWGVKTKPVELSKKLKQIWVALSILIWAVTLQKIDRTKVSGPKMRSKVKILIWNWWKLAKSTILLPGPNKCTHFQMGATTKLEEISKMLRCLFVALYM